MNYSSWLFRFRRYYDIDVEPCTEYSFKIAASEDYQVGSVFLLVHV